MNKFKLQHKICFAFQLLLLWNLTIQGQVPATRPALSSPPPPVAAEEFPLFYYLVLIGAILLVGAFVIWRMKAAKNQQEKSDRLKGDEKEWENEAFDMDKEIEWFRKNAKSSAKKQAKYPANLPKTQTVLARKKAAETVYENVEINRDELKEKLEKIHFKQSPINTFLELKPSKPFEPLPISNDADLMSAVEQVQDEFEEDEDLRNLSLRILSAFKTRNSVESLAQIALYDISAAIRSKAAATLAEFDHESVFETILLTCADPAREVRASAARGLFRLSFDRADAWTRIVETNDEFRINQASRAAVEAGLVERSFDRLIHDDAKIAYEAFAFTALLIKSGENGKIFKVIESHQDHNVKIALLHVLGVVKEESTLANLFDLLENPALSADLKQKVDETIQKFELVPA